jgi:hypothetical protein
MKTKRNAKYLTHKDSNLFKRPTCELRDSKPTRFKLFSHNHMGLGDCSANEVEMRIWGR